MNRLFNLYQIFFLVFLFFSWGHASDSQFIPPSPLYPYYGASPQTSKLKTTIKGNGTIGFPFTDPETRIKTGGFEFPANHDINYLQHAGLWVGGIVDNDTLVSTGICEEYILNDDSTYSTLNYEYDFHPPYINGDTASTLLYNTDDGVIFHTTFSDTFIPTYTSWSHYINKHRPMGLHVTMKTYTKNIPPFKNIVLLDFTIKNKSSKTINSAYVGLYFNTLVQGKCETQFSNDDLIGSFQDEGTVYVMDNDGELNLPYCQNDKASGTMALKTMKTYPPPTDTNFNWWTKWYWNNGYGPRKKGTAEDPFRDIGYGGNTVPVGDSNRYYIMSHPEWDFDQCFTRKIINSDSTWLPADDSILTSVSKGSSIDFLLSLGPFDILPDSSVRTVFALIGTDFVHLDKDNILNLYYENYDAYYNNLYFGLFFDNIRFAKMLTDDYLNPLNKPVGLKADYIDSSSTNLTWDDYVFPEVLGYNIYLKEIPPEYMLSQSIVKPRINFDSIPTPLSLYTSETNQFLFNNLLPGKNYAVVVANITENREGEISEPINIRIGNPFVRPPAVYPVQRFVPIDPEFKNITLKWNYPEGSDINYFKIYRTKDSATAALRHVPFLSSQPDIIPFPPKECFDFDDSTICYYECDAFDSVQSNYQLYRDSLTEEGFYYWISAVNNIGIESLLSPLIKVVKRPETTKDIVAIIGNSTGEQEFGNDDSLISFYNELLHGYNYDIYKWTDSTLDIINCPSRYCVNWEDLAAYKLILVNEYSSPQILTDKTESDRKLFTLLSDLGHNIVYFGIPTGDQRINIASNIDSVIFNKESFERDYMGLEKTNLISWFNNYKFLAAIDSLSGFQAAIPNIPLLPELPIKSQPTFFNPFIKQLYEFNNYVPFVPTFTPTDDAEILYTFKSAFPETSRQQGKPVGIVKKNRNNQVYTFGFHLWEIQLQSAKQLIQYLYSKQSQYFPSYTVPTEISLEQNFPNPFNTGTTISFSLPNQQTVSVEIFNILGQKIKTLLNSEKLSAGSHRIYWDGTNAQNNTVATGIYFYRIQTSENSFTKKMVLLK